MPNTLPTFLKSVPSKYIYMLIIIIIIHAWVQEEFDVQDYHVLVMCRDTLPTALNHLQNITKHLKGNALFEGNQSFI